LQYQVVSILAAATAVATALPLCWNPVTHLGWDLAAYWTVDAAAEHPAVRLLV